MSQVIGVWVCLHAAATFSVEKVLTMLQEGTHKELTWHRKAKALSKSVDRFTIDVARH